MMRCKDCKVDVYDSEEYYMLTQDLWLKVNRGSHLGHLCIGCVENRLGRQLTKVDFSGAPINCQYYDFMTGHMRGTKKPLPESCHNYERKSSRLRLRLGWDEKIYKEYHDNQKAPDETTT